MSVHLLAAFADASRPLHCSASCPRRRSLASPPDRQSLRVTGRLSAPTSASSPLSFLSSLLFLHRSFAARPVFIDLSDLFNVWLLRWRNKIGRQGKGAILRDSLHGFDGVHDGVMGRRVRSYGTLLDQVLGTWRLIGVLIDSSSVSSQPVVRENNIGNGGRHPER